MTFVSNPGGLLCSQGVHNDDGVAQVAHSGQSFKQLFYLGSCASEPAPGCIGKHWIEKGVLSQTEKCQLKLKKFSEDSCYSYMISWSTFHF